MAIKGNIELIKMIKHWKQAFLYDVIDKIFAKSLS